LRGGVCTDNGGGWSKRKGGRRKERGEDYIGRQLKWEWIEK